MRQALVEGPASNEKVAVPRHAIALQNIVLTHLVMPKLPRAIGTGALSKAWEKEGIDSKWSESAWAQKRAQKEKRQNLSDFERFKVMKLRKQVSPHWHQVYDQIGRDVWGLQTTLCLRGAWRPLLIRSCRHVSRFGKRVHQLGQLRSEGWVLGWVRDSQDLHDNGLSLSTEPDTPKQASNCKKNPKQQHEVLPTWLMRVYWVMVP